MSMSLSDQCVKDWRKRAMTRIAQFIRAYTFSNVITRFRRIQECNDITRLLTLSEIIIKRKAEIFTENETGDEEGRSFYVP